MVSLTRTPVALISSELSAAVAREARSVWLMCGQKWVQNLILFEEQEVCQEIEAEEGRSDMGALSPHLSRH